MRKHIIDRDILPVFENQLLTEITPDDLRALCNKVKARGAPATAVHLRDIVKQVYAFAILHGEKVDNPADVVGAASIATFVLKDRALSPAEIRLAFHRLESIAAYPAIKLALRLVLLTLVRKSEHRCMLYATLNRISQLIASRAKEAGLPLEPFTAHDLRRTGPTLLHELGFNRSCS
ncbi:phage integrase central domain-containing protein [Halotalea alkalilenta]|uniref:phage integrase central domain-containing protein n=1 Tax=Halotalea alkalilenta TaxID=376489 RepID=UPI0006947A9C|nr:hypothetical protein [Halotalea alkalilenta]